jgi:Na+-transporting NADH:ubiquinone oxidoreductase subunit NqrB
MIPYKIDARDYQILSLGTFILLGHFYAGWVFDPIKFLTIFCAGLATQLAFLLLNNLPLNGLKSAIITCCGLSLLLHANSWWAYALAITLAISSKFIFQWNNKHIFNPANFGIIVSVMFTNQTWISSGQWGSDIVYILLFAALGLVVVRKVGRVDTSIVYLGVYLGLEYMRQVLYLGWGPEVVWHKLTNGALILFTFFMITDPRTIPNHLWVRVIWTASIAVSSFVIINFVNIYSAPLWMLFFFSMLTPVLDHYFPAHRFEWQPKPKSSVLSTISS